MFVYVDDISTAYKNSTLVLSNQPYLQTFQYKVLNIIFNCIECLFKFKIKESKNCLICNQVDTIEHHLIYCKVSQKIWKKIEEWIAQNLDIYFSLISQNAKYYLEFLYNLITTIIIKVINFFNSINQMVH